MKLAGWQKSDFRLSANCILGDKVAATISLLHNLLNNAKFVIAYPGDASLAEATHHDA